MGAGSSSKRNARNIDVISPRVEVAKTGSSGTDGVVLDSAPLHDVGHGTIHYRYQLPDNSVYEYSASEKKNIPTGYFFHPTLNDFSEGADVSNEDAKKFIKVIKGPASDQNKNVFYITGIGLDGNVSTIPKSLGSENSNSSSNRIFGHRYFAITKSRNHVASISNEPTKSSDKVDEFTLINDTDVEMIMHESSSIKKLKNLLSHHLILPVSIIHVLALSGDELTDDSLLADAISNDSVSSENILITLSVI